MRKVIRGKITLCVITPEFKNTIRYGKVPVLGTKIITLYDTT